MLPKFKSCAGMNAGAKGKTDEQLRMVERRAANMILRGAKELLSVKVNDLRAQAAALLAAAQQAQVRVRHCDDAISGGLCVGGECGCVRACAGSRAGELGCDEINAAASFVPRRALQCWSRYGPSHPMIYASPSAPHFQALLATTNTQHSPPHRHPSRTPFAWRLLVR